MIEFTDIHGTKQQIDLSTHGQFAYNADCMEALKAIPDKYFDLAVVDPPYGGGGTEFKRSDKSRFGGLFDRYGRDVSNCSQFVNVERERGCTAAQPTLNSDAVQGSEGGLTATISATRTGGTWATRYQTHTGGIFDKDIRHWDIAPPPEYFDELARVSKNQIIWGGNYFALPPTRCFLIWRKLTISENFTMAMAEYAWTSFNDNAKVFEFAPQGKPSEPRFHATQKPVELYEWVYSRYAKPGDKILDTHLGSGSSRIAAYNAQLDFVGFEIDKRYFQMEEERFAAHTAQVSLFID